MGHLGRHDHQYGAQTQVGQLTLELANARNLATQMQRALKDSEGETAHISQAYEDLFGQVQALGQISQQPDQCLGLSQQIQTLNADLDAQHRQNADLQAALAASKSTVNLTDN